MIKYLLGEIFMILFTLELIFNYGNWKVSVIIEVYGVV